MLDSDLAELYCVETRTLNQAVRRNIERFPSDFSFQLLENEWESLRSQVVILKMGRGEHRKFPPYVFTQEGIAMLEKKYDVSFSGVFEAIRELKSDEPPNQYRKIKPISE